MAEQIVRVVVDECEPALCAAPSDMVLHCGDKCVIEREAIQELGTVAKAVKSDSGVPAGALWRVVRRAVLQDLARAKENVIMGRIAFDAVKRAVERHKLPVRLARVRYSFDRSVLRVIFTARARVECSQAAQEVGAELRTRVEMKAIGARDEAAIIGGMGPCGRPVCCASWLRRFDPVNVRMARTQGISPNPAVISGMCGKLKCCLRFEQSRYEEMEGDYPADGASVQTPEGPGVVLERNLSSLTVRVRLQSGALKTFRLDDLEWEASGAPKAGPERDEEESWILSEEGLEHEDS